MHSRLTSLVLAIPIAFAVAACQPTAVPATAEPSTAAPSEAPPSVAAPSAEGDSSSPDVGSTIDPDWVTRPALTCGDNARLFPPEALAGFGLGELGLDPAAVVLRSTIADTPDYYPDSGWHRVLDNPDGVTFVAPGNRETPWFEITVGLFDGTLQPIIQGQCTLAIAAPEGVSFGRWWLDPTGPPITPETTTLAILIRERECASGKPPEGRVIAPTIVATADAFEIAVGIRKQLTDQDCPSNPAYAIEIALPEPVGARKLFDASQFPPRRVTTEDPG